VLIVDEVSMLDGDLFDKLEAIGAACSKRKAAPFGGVQLILCGDFFQLPPVIKHGAPLRFCFEARTWGTVVTQAIVLRQVLTEPHALDFFSSCFTLLSNCLDTSLHKNPGFNLFAS
jgi:ATP-dependent DNA helicase PIF1